MPQDQEKCPVDHSTRDAWLSRVSYDSKSGSVTEEQSACPVDHKARANWFKGSSPKVIPEAIEVDASHSSDISENKSLSNVDLPTEREISSIPRTNGDSNWVYPSQKQFFDAMLRKNWNPEKEDMKSVVPIHNAVNEQAWMHILNWERTNYEEALKKCGGIKLTSFHGNSKKITPRAWFNSNILGYEKPFDRHDWKVDRCGVEVEYVIDFYSGKGDGSTASFFLDVRPKINSWEGIKMRLGRAFGWA